MGERELWESRYDTPDLIHGVEPVEFLAANVDLLPPSGLALDIAAGEGRNAVFLAELGFEVIALDISFHALVKCRRLAQSRGVDVQTAAVDLTSFDLPSSRFDLILNINFLQRDLVPAIVSGLRVGGLVIFETLTVDHLRWKPEFNREFLLKRGELLELFEGLLLVKYREAELLHGSRRRSVAGIIMRKAREA